VIIAQTRDHKPELPDEAYRVLNEYDGQINNTIGQTIVMQMLAGQNVYAQPRNKAGQGPLRVWLHNQSFPGLAMTRSLGDGHAKRAGVIAEPELDSMQFDANDITVVPKFIVLATDGLWDVMSNELVAQFLFDIKHYNKSA
jgi:hypothetical protein